MKTHGRGLGGHEGGRSRRKTWRFTLAGNMQFVDPRGLCALIGLPLG